MAEWERRCLGDIATLKMGQSPAGHLVKPLGDELPFLQGNAEFGVHFPTAIFQCDEAPRRSAPGDSLISVRAPVGAINRSDLEYGIGRGLAAVAFDAIDPGFGHHALTEHSRSLHRVAQGTTFSAIGRTDLAELRFPVPPLTEQRRIAEVLDTIDETIKTTERVISKRKALRSGIAADLLVGDTDITALTNGDMSEACRSHQSPRSTQDGYGGKRLPYLLSDVASSTVDGPFGSALKTEHYVLSPGVRVVRLANIGDGQFVDNDQVFIEEDYADALSRHEVRGGDVLVAALGDDNNRPGRACLYPIELEPGIVKADCFRIRCSSLIDSRFLREALNSKDVVCQVSLMAQGVTRDRINLSKLRRIVLQIPSPREQQWIADFLDTIDETIQSDERILVRLQQLRAGLADDLLSGRTRTVAV